ncbi:TonB-dependent hemin, ferrichrome receptor [Bartonella ancashensis]|uniref:TonB-dependent hemin, ferrichrome receptor n=1 Tax=Bartonella ancashensis TaxID=1318743 RepID=A0A0M4M4D3_9HYPH|nr:TonB-dependent hemin, ferrichrome receptor [Bartonella ancashensis]
MAFGVLSVGASSFVLAQNNEDSVVELKPIVIESGRVDPNAITVLTNRKNVQDIDQKQIDGIHDVNRLDPSITYNVANDSFAIRGLDANRILTQIDGIPLPWLSDEIRGVKGGASMFDMNALSAFDIVKGSDSSLYGSGALGGTINLHTLNPEDLLITEKNWGMITKGGYSSIDKSWRLDQALAMRADQTLILFQGSVVDGHERNSMGTIGGYGEERTHANPANFDRNNILFKVHQYLSNNHRLGFAMERFNYKKDTHSLNAASTMYAPASVHDEDDRDRKRFSLYYDYNGDGDTVFDAFHGQLYWQEQSSDHVMSGHRLQSPKGRYLRENLIQNTVYGFSASGDLKRFGTSTIGNTVRFSANIFASKFHQYAYGEDNCHLPENKRACVFLRTNMSDSPDTDSTGFGIAFEDAIDVHGGRFRVIPGIRYDWYVHTPQKTSSYAYAQIRDSEENPPKRSSSRFSPKLRVEWDADTQVTLYAQWAQAFRMPSVSELYVAYAKPPMYYVVGNPDLKPEISNGYDFGIKYGNIHWGGAVSLFVNDYKDFIERVDKGPSEEFMLQRNHYVNLAHVRIHGVEAAVHWNLKNGFHSNFGVSYAKGRDLDKKQDLSSIPPLKSVVGLGYEKGGKWGLDVLLTLVAEDNNVKNKSYYGKVPAYGLFDVLSWWKPLGEKGPIVQAGVYNLFDKKYWNASDLPEASPRGVSPLPKDYFSQPGRNFKVSFVQKF